MRDRFGGSSSDKNTVRTLVFQHAKLLAGPMWNKSHVYLAGRDAADAFEARKHGVSISKIFMAESCDEAYIAAKNRLSRNGLSSIVRQNKLFFGDVEDMIVFHCLHRDIGFLYLDFCNVLTDRVIEKLYGSLISLASGGVFAITMQCGRETFAADNTRTAVGDLKHEYDTIFFDKNNKTLARTEALCVSLAKRLPSILRPQIISAFQYAGAGGLPMVTLLGTLVKYRADIFVPEWVVTLNKGKPECVRYESIPPKFVHKIPNKLVSWYEGI